MGKFGTYEETREWTFDVYEDQAGECRWRLRAGNGETMADSGEGYQSKADCLAAIERMKWQTPQARVIDAARER